MKLHSINADDSIITRLTSVSRFAAFDAAPFLDPDVGEAFDFVPDEPGVICWFCGDGSLESIDVALGSMRKRLTDLYKGTAGAGRRAFERFGFEPTADPKAMREQIKAEHVRIYNRIPAIRTA